MADSTPRRRDPEAARQALLSAGAELFSTLGFESATLDAIAERAKLNKAMVAYYFGSKAGLYDAVVDEGVSLVLDTVTDAGIESQPLDDQLPALVEAIGAGLSKAPWLPGVLIQDYLSGGRQKRPEALESVSRLAETTKRVLERGGAAAATQGEDPHSVHLAMIGALVFFGLTKPYRDEMEREGRWRLSNPDFGAFAGFLGRLLARGLRPRDGSR